MSEKENGTITLKKDTLWKVGTFVFAVLFVGTLLFAFGLPGTGKAVIDDTNSGNFQKLSLNYESIIGDDAFMGNEDSVVTIVEFSDYQCPYCARHSIQVLEEISKKYIEIGKVKYVFRDFTPTLVNPSYHPLAIDIAIATECIREQGGDEVYFQYHDIIFENQIDLSSENLKIWSSELGYNIDACLNSEKYLSEIETDFSEGQTLGIRGTPGFLILIPKSLGDKSALEEMYLEQSGSVLIQPIETKDGNYIGVRISGALPFEVFETAINALI